jgi:hypothetical protein
MARSSLSVRPGAAKQLVSVGTACFFIELLIVSGIT